MKRYWFVEACDRYSGWQRVVAYDVLKQRTTVVPAFEDEHAAIEMMVIIQESGTERRALRTRRAPKSFDPATDN